MGSRRNVVRRGLSGVLSLAVLLGGIGAVVVARAGILDARSRSLLVGASNLSPSELKDGAAAKLEATTAKGAKGYSFEITQTSTITARVGGPKIDVPDPSDPYKSIGLADTYLFYSLIERGTVRPDGFWSELRVGPQPGEKADFANAELRRSALVKDGVSWRNDREGWYRADDLPGIGLDPQTAALLPKLLRDATAPVGKGSIIIDGTTLTDVEASATEPDIPGLVAAKGADYTKITKPIEFGFDDQGRLARIHAVALNTTMTNYDLVVDTVIALHYDDPGPLPAPDPTWVPGPAPTD